MLKILSSIPFVWQWEEDIWHVAIVVKSSNTLNTVLVFMSILWHLQTSGDFMIICYPVLQTTIISWNRNTDRLLPEHKITTKTDCYIKSQHRQIVTWNHNTDRYSLLIFYSLPAYTNARATVYCMVKLVIKSTAWFDRTFLVCI